MSTQSALSDNAAVLKKERTASVVARVIGKEERPAADPATSKGLSEQEVFGSAAGRYISPPFDFGLLSNLCDSSTEMNQLIEAMETNIEGFGHRLVPVQHLVAPINGATPEEVASYQRRQRDAQLERVRIQNFFRSCCTRTSLTKLRRKLRRDLERTGNAFVEVIRNSRNVIVGLGHLPVYQMRLAYEDQQPTEVKAPVLQASEDGQEFVVARQLEYRRMRSYVQGQVFVSGSGGTSRLCWFKQFGDPRTLNRETGVYFTEQEMQDYNGTGQPPPSRMQAGELFHFALNQDNGPYGQPRYIANILAVLGTRQAEELNLNTLNNNNMPSMLMAVSNGQFTEGTLGRIEDYVKTQMSGGMNRSRFLIVEAEQSFEGEQAGQVRVEVTPLTGNQINDAMFQNYIKSNISAIRRSFRLPPLFVGAVDEYTRNVADASRALADEQVFGPERAEVDWFFNQLLLEMDCRFWQFQSRTPNITDNSELISMLSTAERSGGVTPRLARQVVEDVFPQAAELPPVGNGVFDPDVPFSITLAEKVKNLSDPTELNQQVPPVLPGDDVPSNTAPIALTAKSFRKAVIQDLWDVGQQAELQLRRLAKQEGESQDV